MKITNFNNSINFEKKFVAKCNVINNGQPTECKIHELETFIDNDYFKGVSKTPSWANAQYLSVQSGNFFRLSAGPYSHYYVLEDNDENCLGYALTYETDGSCTVDCLETAPRYANGSCDEENREYKYIGETLLSFIAKKMWYLGAQEILLNSSSQAIDFYTNKCGFEKNPLANAFSDTPELILENSKFQELVSRNEEHTEASIDILI